MPVTFTCDFCRSSGPCSAESSGTTIPESSIPTFGGNVNRRSIPQLFGSVEVTFRPHAAREPNWSRFPVPDGWLVTTGPTGAGPLLVKCPSCPLT